MSRYTITVTSDDHADPDATIGYDLALWLGKSDREFETIDALQTAALSRGYSFMPLPVDVAVLLAAHVAKPADRPPHDGPLTALLRHLQSR